MAKKPLEIDMIAGSQLRDTQGEMLSVEGADISDLVAGKGRINDNHGKGFFNSIGRVTYAKKIFKEEDCEDERQRHYWQVVKNPYIYVKAALYDDEDHPNAKAAAAILRNIHKSDVPLKLKASVEGGVVARGIKDASLLARTKIHSVALTFTPANNATLVEPISLDKSQADDSSDMELIKSVVHLAETNVPSFRHITRDASATKVHNNLQKIVDLIKSEGLSGNIQVPSKSQILEISLEAKVKDNLAKIHSLIAQLRQEELEKGWKEAAVGAAMAGAAHLAPAQAAKPSPSPSPKAPTAAVSPSPSPSPAPQVDLAKMPAHHQEAYTKLAKELPILGAIGMMESSGGRNYKHDPITDPKSIHYGHTAGGMFGMMPHSAAFIIKRTPRLAEKYPELAEAAKDVASHHKTFTDRFNSDPEVAIDFAKAFFSRNREKTKNADMLIHSWNHGLKGTWSRFKEKGMDAIKQAPYVQTVKSYIAKLSPEKKASGRKTSSLPARPPLFKPSVLKSMTAGYATGAPASYTGGSVLQTESLEGTPGFKYVQCDKCGKEQIYAKHQVKCREPNCNAPFSLAKLLTVMR